MSLPITMLESMLHNTASKPGFPFVTDDYLIEVNPGNLVKLIDLVTFWNVNHVTIEVEDKKDDRSTKEEKKLQTEQKVEGVQTQAKRKTKRSGSNNKKEADKNGELSS